MWQRMEYSLRSLAWLLALGGGVCVAAGSASGFQIHAGGNGTGNESPITGPYTLSGIVVDASTGAPIRRALVQLNAPRSSMALTDEGGKFLFENLPQIEVGIEAHKPGYADFGEFGESSVPRTVTIGPNTAPAVLKLSPQSAITIAVKGEDGEPVENLPVRVLGSHVGLGRRFWQHSAGGQTDEQGEYRAGNLRPGKYYVSAGPSSRPVGHVGEGAAGSDLGYPRVFYPNGDDLEGAAPVDVIPGRPERVEFSLSTAPLYRISGTVVGGPPGQPCGLRIEDRSGEDVAGVRASPMTGEFRSGEIPAGFYLLKGQCITDRRVSFAGKLPLRVDSSLANITLAVAPTVSIPVAFRTSGDAAQAVQVHAPATVILWENQPSERRAVTWLRREGISDESRMVLQGVEPGTYSIEIRPTDGRAYVAAARYGSLDLLTDDLTVPEGGTTEEIEITVGYDAATASGTVRASGGEAAASGVVILVPSRVPRLVKVAPIENGAFGLSGLAPGPYRVFAVDRADDLEYANPEALRDYLAKAQDVTLSPKQETRLDLQLLRAER